MPSAFTQIARATLGLSLLPLAYSQWSFDYGSEVVRGVNLGGWLVLEPWITPSIFDNTGNENIVDEWTFCELQDTETATSVLQNHWDTWITESDIAYIAQAGLNHIRLPFGYWAIEVGPGEPYIQGQLPYIKNAVSWAQTYGLKVILDLHGAPGSQNGYDNSGQRMAFPTWQSNSTNVERTDAVLKIVAEMFADSYETVSIIAPLNEPAGYDGEQMLEVVTQYWYDSYGNIRYPYGSSRQGSAVELIHDAFQPLSYWANFEAPPNWQGVALDTHIYQVFSDSDVAMTFSEHISTACANQPYLSTSTLWLIVGEWSTSPTDCAPYLNGRGVGARYDGTYPGSTYVGSCTGMTGDANTFSSDYLTFLRQFWEAQTIAYGGGIGGSGGGDGWVYWTWKTEAADEWSYSAGLQYGWIPWDPTDLEYPTICS